MFWVLFWVSGLFGFVVDISIPHDTSNFGYKILDKYMEMELTAYLYLFLVLFIISLT